MSCSKDCVKKKDCEKEKMDDKKIEEVSKKIGNIGCLLTLIFTVPIVLTVFLGPVGLVLGIIIAVIGVIVILSKKGKSKMSEEVKKELLHDGKVFTLAGLHSDGRMIYKHNNERLFVNEKTGKTQYYVVK